MKICHVGNLASNAYVNASFQRRYLGWDAHSYDYGRGHLMWSPQWEDADLDVSGVKSTEWVEHWSEVPIRDGWRRPSWSRILGNTREQPYFLTQEAFDAERQLVMPAFVPLRPFDGCRLTAEEIRALNKDFRQQRRWPAIQELAKEYDVVVLYGPEAASAAAIPSSTKVVTFECSTMRMVAQLDTPSRRSLAKAYQVADLALITNADCVRSARELGLTHDRRTEDRAAHPGRGAGEHPDYVCTTRGAQGVVSASGRALGRLPPHANEGVAAGAVGRYAFMPHPVDTDKFHPAALSTDTPGLHPHENPRVIEVGGMVHLAYDLAPDEATLAARLRENLLSRHGTDLLLLAPARHALALREGPKANDKVLHAFAQYLDQEGRQRLPRATLLLLHYGDAVAESKALIERWGISHRVLWMPPLPKRQYVQLVQAADIVLDQFSEDVGSFGTTTIEALACAKPCITFVSPRLHEWCKDTLPLPPVANALNVVDIVLRLKMLAHPEKRQEYGERGARWVQEWQSPQRVCAVWQQLVGGVMGWSGTPG